MSAVLSVSAFGQFSPKEEDSRKSDRREIVREARLDMKSTNSPTSGAVTVEEVGEPDSFGKNAKFLGTATTGIVYFYFSCDPTVLQNDLDLTLGPDDRCVVSPLGAVVGDTFNDIGRITIPGRTVDNVIYFIQSNLFSFDTTNPTANPVYSTLLYSPSYTLESTALNDPAAINPSTGLPMNGSFTTGVGGSRQFTRQLGSGIIDAGFERFSSSGTRGFARSYFEDLGLPQSVINKIYNRPLTIRLNLRVRGNYLQFGQFGYSVRFLGN